MRKIIKLILKSDNIKKRFLDKVKSKIKKIKDEKDKCKDNDNDNDNEDELDNHNDPCNWSYALNN
jgi:hypothetical protein